MKVFRSFFIISIALIILYVLVAKSELYVAIFRKVTEWASNGFSVLTTGKYQGQGK